MKHECLIKDFMYTRTSWSSITKIAMIKENLCLTTIYNEQHIESMMKGRHQDDRLFFRSCFLLIITQRHWFYHIHWPKKGLLTSSKSESDDVNLIAHPLEVYDSNHLCFFSERVHRKKIIPSCRLWDRSEMLTMIHLRWDSMLFACWQCGLF